MFGPLNPDRTVGRERRQDSCVIEPLAHHLAADTFTLRSGMKVIVS
jgi:hypothetical protein